MRVREFLKTLVHSIGRADAEDEDGRDERPEETLLAVAERVTPRGRLFVKAQSQQQENLVRRVGHRMQRFCHHSRRTRDDGGHELQDRNQTVGKERADDCQHLQSPLNPSETMLRMDYEGKEGDESM